MAQIPNPENPNTLPGFVEAAMTDIKFVGLLQESAQIDYRVGILEEQEQAQHTHVPETLLEQRTTAQDQLTSRESHLRDIWNEANGDRHAFSLLLQARDWQSIAESEVDLDRRQEALSNFRKIMSDLDDYRYDN
jgi:hypothetical protein